MLEEILSLPPVLTEKYIHVYIYIYCYYNSLSEIDITKLKNKFYYIPGSVAQSVTCLTTDACLTADPAFPWCANDGPTLNACLVAL